MTIALSHAQNALVLRVAGRLDALTSPDFESTCRQSISPETRTVVLDLQDLEYLSSAGLRALLLLGKLVQAGGGTLALAGLRGTARAILELSGFYTLFPVFDSVEVALEPR